MASVSTEHQKMNLMVLIKTTNTVLAVGRKLGVPPLQYKCTQLSKYFTVAATNGAAGCRNVTEFRNSTLSKPENSKIPLPLK